MLKAHRALIILVLALLVIPALAMPFLPFRSASLQENRMLARPLEWPVTVSDWRLLPRKIDAYLADHFAFREQALWVGMRVEKRLGVKARAQELAVTGENGQMFLTEGLLRSTGQDVDPARAADYADFVCQVSSRLRARGVKVITSLAPSPAGITPDLAPIWALPVAHPTDYDLILRDLKACGTPAIDLRPPLIAASKQAKLYRQYDSHWTPRGALLAYNEIATALNQPDWRVAPESLQWAKVPRDDGDLLRMAGSPPATEVLEINNRGGLPPEARRSPVIGVISEAMPPFKIETGHAGPSVLIIGDSFTADFFPPLIAPFVGRIVWVHNDLCRFDWRIVDIAKPDIVMIVPAERNALCGGGRPRGFPAG